MIKRMRVLPEQQVQMQQVRVQMVKEGVILLFDQITRIVFRQRHAEGSTRA